MDMTVTHLGEVIVTALRDADYAPSTIGQYEKTIRQLTSFVAERAGVYHPALGADFAAGTSSPRTGRFSAQRRYAFTRLVTLFDTFINTGEVVLRPRTRGGGGPSPTSAEFTTLYTAWDAHMLERGLVLATRQAYGRIARGYLVYLEHHGIEHLAHAQTTSITGFLESLLDRWAKTSLFWVVSNFRPFLAFTGRQDLVDAVGLAGIHRHHRIVQVASDEDVQLVIHACSTGDVVTARDASITLLALTTGLRACDIIALRLANIHWRSATASIIQQKTRHPVTLPLPSLLMARLSDYVLKERPRTDDDHVFLRRLAPHTPLSDHASIHRVTSRVFTVAGASTQKIGARILRHTAATRLLRAATPLPTISAVLGHANEESTGVYLSVDDERLRLCVLPVPAGAWS